jgi:hypothetical protein
MMMTQDQTEAELSLLRQQVARIAAREEARGRNWVQTASLSWCAAVLFMLVSFGLFAFGLHVRDSAVSLTAVTLFLPALTLLLLSHALSAKA